MNSKFSNNVVKLDTCSIDYIDYISFAKLIKHPLKNAITMTKFSIY